MRRILPLLLLSLSAARSGAQSPHRNTPSTPTPASADSAADSTNVEADDEGVPLGLQYGVATGALHYGGGRTEQALGVLIRWAPVRWFSLSGTPTVAQVAEASTPTTTTRRSGLTDLPIEAAVSHAFSSTAYKPTLSAALGATLPVGDSATGFGQGRLGYSASVGLGLAPTDEIWLHLGAGRTLSGFSPQAAFMSGSAWGDVSTGTSLTERLSVSTGFSSDLGSVDPTLGRSMTVNAGMAFVVNAPTTVHIVLGKGVSGQAPSWSIGLGFGTAFPYLNHLGADAFSQLSRSFGGGSHGLVGSVVGRRGRP